MIVESLCAAVLLIKVSNVCSISLCKNVHALLDDTYLSLFICMFQRLGCFTDMCMNLMFNVSNRGRLDPPRCLKTATC